MSDSTLIRFAGEPRHDGRTVYGIGVPYGQPVPISERGETYDEQFVQGSFSRSISERGAKVRLMIGHDRQRLPIGRSVDLRDEHDGLHVAFEIANTREGDDVLELVRDGLADSFSIGFRPVRSEKRAGVVTRVEAALIEVSLVAMPAYAGALVGGIRTATPPLSTDEARRRLSVFDW